MRSIRRVAAIAAMVAVVVLGAASSTSAVTPSYTLQVLHLYGETGMLGVETAPILGALSDKFKTQYANTLTLSEGDIWIPGPWLVGGADPSLDAVPGIGITALGRPDVAIMNALGVNASALGNHEFDLGSPVVKGAIAGATRATPPATWVGAQFPLITANLDFSAEATGSGGIKDLADKTLGGPAANSFAGQEASAIKAKIAPYAVVTIGGEKIGLVGATTWELLSKTSPNGTAVKDDGNPATDKLHETATWLQAAVDSLTALGVNKIVMVDQLDTIDRNKQLAPLVSGIDIMVAGGGHERMGDANDTAHAFNGHDADFVSDAYPLQVTDAGGKPTLIVTTDTEYTYLGRLVIGFDANGVIDPTSYDVNVSGSYPATEASLQAAYGVSDSAATIVAGSTAGSKIKAIADAINGVVTQKNSIIHGYSKVYLEGDRVFGRVQEVNLGDLTADANWAVARTALGSAPPLMSLKNGGGIRASIGSIDEDGGKVANPPDGRISQLDVENALRFDNKLMVFDTTPQGLLNILNFGSGQSVVSNAYGQFGGYPQVGGVRFSFDPTLPLVPIQTPPLPLAQRVKNVALWDLDGHQVAKVIENGAVAAGAPATITVVTLNFTANDGDSYPIKANGTNFRYLLVNGGVSAPVDPALNFTAESTMQTVGQSLATVLGEQKAFQTYLAAAHGTPAKAYDVADTPREQDLRIQNIAFRSDATFDTTKPTLTVPGDIRVNATSPTGAVVTFAVTATDPDDSPATITIECDPASGSTFPLRGDQRDTKTTRVTCEATDRAGNASEPASFAVTVLGVEDQIEALERAVDRKTWGRLGKELTKSLEKAADRWDHDNHWRGHGRKGASACSYMQEFKDDVDDHTPPITGSDRNAWLADANRIRAVMGCK